MEVKERDTHKESSVATGRTLHSPSLVHQEEQDRRTSCFRVKVAESLTTKKTTSCAVAAAGCLEKKKKCGLDRGNATENLGGRGIYTPYP